MKKYENTISKKGKIYEVYNTNNPVIKYLSKRFFTKIEYYLDLIDARNLKGIDIGCGEGHMLNSLYDRGLVKEIMGIDLDHERVEYAQNKYPNIRFCIEDVYELKLPKNKYDYVMALEILEHLPEPSLALENMRKIIKPNGFIILSVPYEPYFQIGNVLRGKHLKRLGKTPAHLHFWSKNGLINMINDKINVEYYHNLATFPWQVILGQFK